MRRLLLTVLVVGTSAASFAQTTPSPAPVTLTQPTPDTYTLANGIVSLTLDGPRLAVTSIVYKGEDMVSHSGSHDHIYWSMDGPPNYQVAANAACTVKSNTPEMADVGCKHTYTSKGPHPDAHAVDIDIHYVVRRNKPGVYAYAILSHPAAYPAADIGEWRMVWPTGTKDGNYLLDRIYVDDRRHWTMPTLADRAQAQTMPIKEVSLFRSGAWAGKMESKYTYAVNYESTGAFGFASDTRQIGAWTVMGSFEYYNDGPHKQDLTALAGTMTHHFGRNHYNGTGLHLAAGEQWSKIFGPFLLFFNSGLPADALWSDARAQSVLERAQWPYPWLTGVPEYPAAAERGAVTGKLLIADSLNPGQTSAYALVGLAQPAPGADFQTDASHYQYWAEARADGTFTLRGVRPGTYTLYAYVNGEVGQLVRENVTVTAAHNEKLSNLVWTVPRTGTRLAWEIGHPDRDSVEFRHGEDFFTPYLYKTFWRDLPNPLVYDADTGDWTKQWNYAQSMYVTPDGRAQPWRWTIRFNLASVPKTGDAALIVALAGSNAAQLAIRLNGSQLTQFRPKLDGGNGLLRQTSYGKYSNYSIPVPLSRLHVGQNTLDLDMTDAHGEASVIFYDYLALELP
ncbi:MAG: polysaccharide lyase family protein [Acidobacteriota bacterium]|nr:polysaccharide lyase family protein [Acidobacteriota bacterium]